MRKVSVLRSLPPQSLTAGRNLMCVARCVRVASEDGRWSNGADLTGKVVAGVRRLILNNECCMEEGNSHPILEICFVDLLDERRVKSYADFRNLSVVVNCGLGRRSTYDRN